MAWWTLLFWSRVFAAYAVLASREEATEPDLVGPAATIGALDVPTRRLSILGLFVFAGGTIATAAEPFAEGLVHTGQNLGIDEFLLVQWLAPLASEAPEFLIAALLALRGKAGAAMGLLLSAKLNQWTLLVGSLPLAFSVGAGQLARAAPGFQAGQRSPAHRGPESVRDRGPGQHVAVAARGGAAGGAVPGPVDSGGRSARGLHNAQGGEVELILFSVVYVLLSLVFLYHARRVLRLLWRAGRAKMTA